jgi:hypothetical protein
LASASNVAVESERRSIAHVKEPRNSSTWREWLGALFAPRVLRFAVPVLALGLIGVVAFVALRSGDAGQSVALKDSEPNKGRVSITQQAPAPGEGLTENANANANASGGNEAGFDRTTTVAPPPGTYTEGPRQEKDAPASVSVQTAPNGGSAPPPPAPSPSIVMDGQEGVGVVGEVASAPKAVSKESRDALKSAEESEGKSKSDNRFILGEGQNQEAANRGSQPRKVDIGQMPDGATRGASRSDSNNVGNRSINNLPELSRQSRAEDERAATSAKRSARPAEARNRREQEPPADDETRGVSGHRFRRRDGAWVDVNYRGTMSMVGVQRGTEGYRALVADVPELGRIAEQLQGEVIVVVKGRAYRIR